MGVSVKVLRVPVAWGTSTVARSVAGLQDGLLREIQQMRDAASAAGFHVSYTDGVFQAIGACFPSAARGSLICMAGYKEFDAYLSSPDPDDAADLFAAGVFTTVPTLGAFARPRQNSEPFRSSDALARSLWQALAGSSADREDAAQQRAIEATTYTF